MKISILLLFFAPVRCSLSIISLNEDVEVSCVFNDSCVLPCSFQSGPDTVIHWIKKPEESFIYSYYYGQDQFSHQQHDFRDRSSLFVDEISRGNASLLLREVKVQDEGRHVCVTSTNSENKATYINLNVFAPVTAVTLEQRGDELVYRSEGLYPEPDVSWSSSNGTETNTSVSVSEEGLYSIFSSVRLSHKPPEEHSCNISTDHSWSSATYRLQSQIPVLENETIIPCSASKATIKSLIWRFNLTELILKRTGAEVVFNESWRQFVEEVSESGRLILKNLSSGHQGVYSCHFSSDRETHISSTHLTIDLRKETSERRVTAIISFNVAAVAAVVCLCLFGLYRRNKKSDGERNENATENAEASAFADFQFSGIRTPNLPHQRRAHHILENDTTNESPNPEEERTQENKPQELSAPAGLSFNNHRPISNLPFLGKVIEKVVY